MSKTVAFRMPAPRAAAADSWVDDGVEPHLKPAQAPVSARVIAKRLTLDVPATLHARVKLACLRDKTMLEEIIRLLEAEFPASS